MTMTNPDLPRSAQEIADVIGRSAALRLIGMLPRRFIRDKRYKGAKSQYTSLYVPAVLPADHWLVRVLGWDTAKRLSDVFGGEIIKPSACAEVYRAWRNREIVRMANDGITPGVIADIVGVSQKLVFNVIKGNPTGGSLPFRG